MKTLILGGARSGKSALAERMAADAGHAVTYVATAQAFDAEMAERIDHHRARRPSAWTVVEEPIHLAAVLRAHATPERFLLVDCLTLWLSNLLGTDDGAHFERERAQFFDVLPALPGEIVFVTNEVGLGVVPMGELTRRYVDEAGRLHQMLAARCECVLFVAAGLPLALKGSLP
ncbi:bifunctional adenosylcobinamide kinase/adenosylcobinamide-phosphate guanylyltransferase [Luteibacter aegosomatis]|uniref:bifunctional adenosylcobinamide kinase/adenosylcobinamide-phosphate guanylyltransferase n=1 Tax=Luteibacter aegosomatis TaxID=2911537 RepID=UPI001FF735E0|nr:bifunctional adenosylcobinamide kinase/adenosylcobinamide-phosphate guanylyltransferase [Luteibacter aegosomatis]UPG86148.1 bifunctional adenosylcobinamide kinase/adenosylcobinamide-phosphate guanylyltransferase [Luteibacter aegosomatis]